MPDETLVPQQDDFGLSDEQIDSLLAGHDLPEESSQPDQSGQIEASTAPAQSVPQTPQLKRFKADGKEIEATEEQLIQWASQGYNYGRHMNEFKEKYGLYEKIDQYALQNPQWWENIKSSFGKVEQNPTQSGGQTQDDPLNIFKSEIDELKQFKDDFIRGKEEEKQKLEDQKLESEVNEVRQKYPDLDWKGYDSSGKTLEYRVLEHAGKIGTSSFNAAFKDLMFDDLVNRQVSKVKDETVKTMQKNQKLGLLGETPDPLKRYLPEYNKAKSWDDLYNESLEEFGITN